MLSFAVQNKIKMKNSNIYRFFFLSFFSVFLISCSNDDAEVFESFGISTGDYLPLASNNKWWYESDNNEVSLVSAGYINEIDNVQYFRFVNTGDELDITYWIRKNGASYFQKTGESQISTNNGVTVVVGAYEIILLKDDLSVGESWHKTLPLRVEVYNGGAPQNVPASLSYTCTILERDVSETIFDEVYENVIKVKMQITQIVNSQTMTIDSETWFAKDVGIIKESVYSSVLNAGSTKYLTSVELN